MSITIRCPNASCNATSSLHESLIGRSVKCKRCGTPFKAAATEDGGSRDTKQSGNRTAGSTNFVTLPAEFGRYRVLKLLGRGGMGSVYLAHDTKLGRQVALKLPSFGPDASSQRVKRFIREAQSSAILHHPNVCTLFDVGEIDQSPFLSMAYIEGRPLDSLIDPEHPLEEKRVATLIRKIALALAHAHAKGIVHRDLKPANVMITPEDEPVVMDFGLAKRIAEDDAVETKLTSDGAVMGTPSYMAPEQVRGDLHQIGPLTDVYALGVMLFELLTGATPYGGPVGVVMAQILTSPVPSLRSFRPKVDPRLESLCHEAMAKQSADRIQNMQVFADRLAAILTQPPESKSDRPFNQTESSRIAGTSSHFDDIGEDNLESAEEQRTRDRKKRKRSRKQSAFSIPLVLGAALVLFAVLASVIWMTVRTKYGDVVIELNEPGAKVEVKIDNERIELVGLEKPIHLTAGEHGLTVVSSEYETVTQQFAVKKGEKQIVRVTLKKNNSASLSKDTSQKPRAPSSAEVGPKNASSAPDISSEVAGDWISLLNQSGIQGWTEYGHPNWSVNEGVLTGKPVEGKPGFIMTEADFDHFELELQYRLGVGAGSGLFLRADPNGPVSGAGQMEIQLIDDEFPKFAELLKEQKTGSLYGVFARKNEPVLKRQDWNSVRVRMVKRSLQVWINDTQTVDVNLDSTAQEHVEKVPGLLRTTGRIGLQQNQQSDVEFRNIRIRRIEPPKPKLPEGFVALFNGKDLAGWEYLSNTWRIEDGIVYGILPPGRTKHTYLCSNRKFKDFELRFKVRLKNGEGNSGAQIRSKIVNADEFIVGGPQVEIDSKTFGGLYGELIPGKFLKQVDASEVRRVFKADEFNDYVVRCVGKRVSIEVNGEKLVDDIFTEIETEGIIAFQLHGRIKVEELSIKEAMIRELTE